MNSIKLLTIFLLLTSSVAKVNAQWVSQTSGTTNDLYNASFIDSNTGWVVGKNGTVLKTVNSGLTWTQLTTNTTDDIYAVSFVSSTTGYVCGESFRNMKTTNGGTSWNSWYYSFTQNIKSIHAFSATNVIGVGDSILFRTDNSFGHIDNYNLSVGVQNCLIFSSSAGNCWMVGNGGSIKKITGTITTTTQTSGTTEDLLGIHFPTATNGFVVGKNGTILKTTNGGTNWNILTSGVSVDLYSVFFTDANTGYAVGENETILKTTDGGNNWTIQMSGANTNQTHRFVWFTDANKGWIVGSNGAIYHTSNGGEASVGIATTPFGPKTRCETPATFSTSAVNATSYLWSLDPVASGSIIESDTTVTITWNINYSGNTIITVQGQNDSQLGSVSNPLIVYGYPSAFSLLSPSNNTWVSETPLFQWASSTGTLSYQLFIDGTLFKDSITTTSYQVLQEDAFPSGMHTWNVVAKNGCTTQSNETRSFRVDTTPPTAFNLITPADNSWTNSLQPILEWSPSIDSHSGLAKYQLWIDGVLNRDNILPSSTSTTPIVELSNDTHTWEIKAVDNVGNIRVSNQTLTVYIDNTPPGTADYCARISNSDTRGFFAVNTSNYFNPQNMITIEGWFKPSSINTSVNTTLMNLNNYECDVDYSIYITPTYQIKFYLSNVGTLTYNSSSFQLLNKWNHFAGVYDGTNLVLYMNGGQVAFLNVGQRLITRNPLTYFKIGFKNCYSYGGDRFWGDIDEIRVWNYGRSQLEILAGLYTEIEPSTDLLAYWRFNEDFLLDYSNNGNSLNYNDASYPSSKILKSSDYLGNSNSLIYPEHYQDIETNLPIFKWNVTSDNGIGFEKYQLLINNIVVADNLYDTVFNAINPLNYGFNYWSVIAYDSLENGRPSVSRIFFVDNVSPNPFNLISPTNNEIVMFPTPELSWEAATDSTGGSGMQKYQLWINGVVNRDSIPIGTTTTSPARALPQGEYTWFVRAYDNVGNFRQSTETRTFYVDWETPTDFALISPSDGATVTTAQTTFEWGQSFDYGSGLSKYELCISGYSPIEISPTETEHSLTFELPNGTYSWFVKAYDNANAFTSSNTHTLNVAVPLPEQATTPTGITELCVNSANTEYTTIGAMYADYYNWEITPSIAGTISGIGLTSTVSWNSTFSGTAQITVTSHNQIGPGPVSNALSVTIYPTTVAGFVSGTRNICFGDSTGILILSNYTGNIVKWQKSLNISSWVDISDTHYTFSEIPSATGMWQYRALVQSGVCTPVYSAVTVITVDTVASNAEIISGPISVCQGQNAVNYSIPAISNATSYIWTLPEAATGNSSSNQISVNYGSTSLSGNITVRGQNHCGIGSVSVLQIAVNQPVAIDIFDTICQGESYTDNGFNATVAGTYTLNLETVYGCDSTVALHLRVNPTYHYSSVHEMCDNESYQWRNTLLTDLTAGDYTYFDSLQSINECDSIYQLNLTIHPTYMYNDALGICSNELPYMYGDTVFQTGTVSGVYPIMFRSIHNCDSLVNLNLNVHPTYYFHDNFEMCDNGSYQWQDTALTGLTTGTYTFYNNLQSDSGCDSIYELTLTVHPTYHYISTHEMCDNESYQWRNNLLTGLTSGEYTYFDSLQSINGCDSLYQLNLTVNPTYMHNDAVIICGNELPFIYGDSLFSQAGVYQVMFTTINNCDSLINLTLSVNPTSLTLLTDTICQGDGYFAHGFNLPSDSTLIPGTFQYHLDAVNQYGCDSTVLMTLTINPNVGSIGIISGNTLITQANDYLYSIDPVDHATAYQWNISNSSWTLAGNNNSATLTISVAGNGTLSVVASNNCGVTPAANLYIQSTISITSYDNIEGMKVYPNPTNDNIELLIENSSSNVTEVGLFDLYGKLLKIVKVKGQITPVTLGEYANGVYFLRVMNKNTVLGTFKVVKN